MSFFGWLFDSDESSFNEPLHSVNPANGLPMLNDTVDVAGNPFGTDYTTSIADTSSSCDSGSMFDGSSSWDSGPTFDSSST